MFSGAAGAPEQQHPGGRQPPWKQGSTPQPPPSEGTGDGGTGAVHIRPALTLPPRPPAARLPAAAAAVVSRPRFIRTSLYNMRSK